MVMLILIIKVVNKGIPGCILQYKMPNFAINIYMLWIINKHQYLRLPAWISTSLSFEAAYLYVCSSVWTSKCAEAVKLILFYYITQIILIYQTENILIYYYYYYY